MAGLVLGLILCLLAAVAGQDQTLLGPPLISFGPHYHVKIVQSHWPSYVTTTLDHWYDGANRRSRTDHIKDSLTELQTYQFPDRDNYGIFYTVDPLEKCWELHGTWFHPVHIQHGLPTDLSGYEYVGSDIVNYVATAQYVKLDKGYTYSMKDTLWVTFQKRNLWSDLVEPVPIKHQVSKIMGFVEYVVSTSHFSGYSSTTIDPEIFDTPTGCSVLQGSDDEVFKSMEKIAGTDFNAGRQYKF